MRECSFPIILYITVARCMFTVRESLIDLHGPMIQSIQTIDEAERKIDFDTTNETSVLRANARRRVYNVTHVGVFLGYSCHLV